MTRELTRSVVPSGSRVPVPSSGLLSTWSTRDWSDGIHIADVSPLERLIVRTANSTYELIVLCPATGSILVRGGAFFPVFMPGPTRRQLAGRQLPEAAQHPCRLPPRAQLRSRLHHHQLGTQRRHRPRRRSRRHHVRRDQKVREIRRAPGNLERLNLTGRVSQFTRGIQVSCFPGRTVLGLASARGRQRERGLGIGLDCGFRERQRHALARGPALRQVGEARARRGA